MNGLVSSSFEQPKLILKTATSFGNAVGFEFIFVQAYYTRVY